MPKPLKPGEPLPEGHVFDAQAERRQTRKLTSFQRKARNRRNRAIEALDHLWYLREEEAGSWQIPENKDELIERLSEIGKAVSEKLKTIHDERQADLEEEEDEEED